MKNNSYTYNLSVITITYSYLCTMKQSNLNKLTNGGRKPLMSELLQDTREFIKLSEQADVEALRQFLFNDPELPLIAMGHGGSYSSAAFAALLYGTRCALGRAVTPYQANSFSDTTLKNSKLLLFSSSLKNKDAEFIAKRMALVNPQHSCVITSTDADNPNIQRMKKSCPDGVINYPFDFHDGFIAVNSTTAYFSLLYKVFTREDDFSSKLALSAEPDDNFTYRCADDTTTPPDLGTITQLTVLYGSYGEPVARKFESNIIEAGLASCVVSDYRDECHGRFLALSNFVKSKKHPQTDCALVLLVTPREEILCKNFVKQLPGHMPIIIIHTDFDSPLGALDLLYKANIFTSHFGEHFRGYNPNDPDNLGGFDKRAFRNNVLFAKELTQHGPLQLS